MIAISRFTAVFMLAAAPAYAQGGGFYLDFEGEPDKASYVMEKYPGHAGLVGYDHDGTHVHKGKSALRLACRASGAGPDHTVAWMYDLVKSPKHGKMVNLDGTTLECWVWLPGNALGVRYKPAGVRLVVKSGQAWRSRFGKWVNACPGWAKLSLKVAADPNSAGYQDEGFDPSQVRAIGFCYTIPEGTPTSFEGSIWIDELGLAEPERGATL